jgi:hypothetical protein
LACLQPFHACESSLVFHRRHLSSGRGVKREADVEADMLEDALDVLKVLEVDRTDVGEHRHLGGGGFERF